MINFAIIGCGSIGNKHAKHAAEYGKLIAVCDILENRAISLAQSFNASSYTDYKEMLKSENNIDVVVVCSPNGLHALHSLAALRSGFHVLCEKPMALNVQDCKKMNAASEKFGKHLFLVMQNRFNPPVVVVKHVLENSILGKIFSVQLNCFWNRNTEYYKNTWRGTKSLDGGVLYTQFSHFIDLLHWFFGDIKESNSFIANYNHKGLIQFEDTGVVNLLFKTGVIGTMNYTINSYSRNMEGSLTIFGEKGTIKIGGQYLNVLEYQDIYNYKINNIPEGNKPNNYGSYFGSMSNHDSVYKNVIEVLNGDGSIATNGIEGLKTIETITKIYKNAKYISN